MKRRAQAVRRSPRYFAIRAWLRAGHLTNAARAVAGFLLLALLFAECLLLMTLGE